MRPVVIVVGHHPLRSVGPHGTSDGSAQDLGSAPYTRLRSAIASAFAGAEPLVYAAGHDHLLQAFEGPTARYTVVSGAGSTHKVEGVKRGAPWLFARGERGYMRLDVYPARARSHCAS